MALWACQCQRKEGEKRRWWQARTRWWRCRGRSSRHAWHVLYAISSSKTQQPYLSASTPVSASVFLSISLCFSRYVHSISDITFLLYRFFVVYVLCVPFSHWNSFILYFCFWITFVIWVYCNLRFYDMGLPQFAIFLVCVGSTLLLVNFE